MIQLAVLDIAGTTIEDRDAVSQCFQDALSAAGILVDPSYVATLMGYAKPEAIRRMLERSGHASNADAIETIHDDFVNRMIHHYRTDPNVRPLPGAAEGIARLRAEGIKVALDTGFSRAIVAPLLERVGWGVPGQIDAYICSDQVSQGRPAPDMIRALMAQLGITDPATIAKVGDTASDLGEGLNVGCSLNIGVTTGAYTRAQLQVYPHSHIVDSFAEAVQIILAQR